MYTGLPPYMQNRASCSVRPPGSAPNGIVTDASELVPALRRPRASGVRAHGLRELQRSIHRGLAKFVPAPTMWARATTKLMGDFAVHKAASARITAAIKHLIAQHDLDVLEIEEFLRVEL